MLLAGIKRRHQFSPNHVGNDQAIFDLTAGRLRDIGYQVNEYAEDDLPGRRLVERSVFSMAREPQVLKILQQHETDGAVVVNSGYGIENCFRNNMTRRLNEGPISVPDNCIVDTYCPDPAVFESLGACWVKRGDFHAIHREDVAFAPNAAAGCSILAEYARRGITSATLSKHIPGDLLKFYGVRGTDFFFYFYPEEYNHSKFGYEAINGKCQYYPVDMEQLKVLAEEAANILQIDVYGGDVIVSADGMVYLIDMNDWPSFAPCRDQAAPYIAQRIHQRISG